MDCKSVTQMRWLVIGTCRAKMCWIYFALFMVMIPVGVMLPSSAQAGPINGGFEEGTLNGWTTTTYTNAGGTNYSLPMDKSKLNLVVNASGNSTIAVRNSSQGQYVTPFPQSGSYAAVINENGDLQRGGGLKQTFTVSSSDKRLDGNIHVVAAYAFVLDASGTHTASQQPYFYMEIKNETKKLVLYSKFAYAGEPGIAATTSGNYYYSNWQVADVSSENANTPMSDGDQITIEVIAAGCYKSNGKHAGWAYLDTTGSVYPGLSISASGPTVVSAGSNLTYKFSYSNFGNASATNTSASFVLPPSTTFQTSSGASCTTPSVGSNGTVTCTLNTVPSNTSGAFYVTIKDNGASGTITNGNYFIQAAGLNALYGAAFTTSILTTYPVSTSPGANGTLSCTPTTVNMGSTTSCTATANTGYYLSSISGCGINYTNSTPSVTSNIISSTAYNSDCTVSSTYAPVTAPPAVTTVAASNITTSSATLNGTIVDNGATTSVTFDYGADTNYGSNAGATTGGTVNAGAGSTPVALVLSGITCNSTYHFRVKGVNTAGTTNGLDSSFTTLACSPAISNLNDTMSYLIGSGAKVIDQGTAASITDAGLSNFNGGTLTVSIASVVNADQLGIHDQGSEANHITVSGITVKYNGNQIGTITSNGNGTSLTVSLDTVNATMTAVSALLNNITYANTSLSNAGTRSVTFSLENGVTGTSAGTSTATIHQTRPGLHQLWG